MRYILSNAEYKIPFIRQGWKIFDNGQMTIFELVEIFDKYQIFDHAAHENKSGKNEKKTKEKKKKKKGLVYVGLECNLIVSSTTKL